MCVCVCVRVCVRVNVMYVGFYDYNCSCTSQIRMSSLHVDQTACCLLCRTLLALWTRLRRAVTHQTHLNSVILGLMTRMLVHMQTHRCCTRSPPFSRRDSGKTREQWCCLALLLLHMGVLCGITRMLFFTP